MCCRAALGRGCGIPKAQLALGSSQANSPLCARTSAPLVSARAAAADKYLRKSGGSCEGQEAQMVTWEKARERINKRERTEGHREGGVFGSLCCTP